MRWCGGAGSVPAVCLRFRPAGDDGPAGESHQRHPVSHIAPLVITYIARGRRPCIPPLCPPLVGAVCRCSRRQQGEVRQGRTAEERGREQPQLGAEQCRLLRGDDHQVRWLRGRAPPAPPPPTNAQHSSVHRPPRQLPQSQIWHAVTPAAPRAADLVLPPLDRRLNTAARSGTARSLRKRTVARRSSRCSAYSVRLQSRCYLAPLCHYHLHPRGRSRSARVWAHRGCSFSVVARGSVARASLRLGSRLELSADALRTLCGCHLPHQPQAWHISGTR